MATITWRGDWPPTAQVTLLTVTDPGTSSATLTVTINGKSVGVAVINTQTAIATAALFYDALIASTIPEFLEMTWTYTVGDAFVTGTGTNPGVPVTITGSTAGGQTVTPSNTTDATGPNDVAQAGNWVGAVLPGNGDTIQVAAGGDLLYNLDEFASNTLTGIEIWASFTGTVGLPLYNSSGNGSYLEYRPRYLQSNGNPTVTIGQGIGAGSGRIRIDVTGGTGAILVYLTGQRLDTDVPSFNVINTASTTTLTVDGGDAGSACEPNQAGTIASLSTPVARSGQNFAVTLGAGITLTAADCDGGIIVNFGTVGTLTITGGTWTQYGAVPTTIVCDGGVNGVTVVLRGTGTTTTATFRGQNGNPAPVCDCSADPRARTFTNGTFVGGAVLNDPNNTVIMTNPLVFDGASATASNFGNGQYNLKRT